MINKDLKEFKDLSKDEKIALFEFWLDNGFIYTNDSDECFKAPTPLWVDNAIYTTEKPIELKDGCWYLCESNLGNKSVLYYKSGYMYPCLTSIDEAMTTSFELSWYRSFKLLIEAE